MSLPAFQARLFIYMKAACGKHQFEFDPENREVLSEGESENLVRQYILTQNFCLRFNPAVEAVRAAYSLNLIDYDSPSEYVKKLITTISEVQESMGEGTTQYVFIVDNGKSVYGTPEYKGRLNKLHQITVSQAKVLWQAEIGDAQNTKKIARLVIEAILSKLKKEEMPS